MITLTGNALSEKVAYLYGIEASRRDPAYWDGTQLPLHEDDARCFQLMVEHRLMVSFDIHDVDHTNQMLVLTEHPYFCANHDAQIKPFSTAQVRIGILQCLVKMKEVES